MCLPISRWVIYKHICPHSTERSAVFDPKWHDPCAPPSLFTQSRPQQVSLFPWMKKALKGQRFADVEEVRQTAEALQGIKVNEFKTCSEQWKKMS